MDWMFQKINLIKSAMRLKELKENNKNTLIKQFEIGLYV